MPIYTVYFVSWAWFCNLCQERVTPIKPVKAGSARPYPKLFLKHLKEKHPNHLSTNPDGWAYQLKADFAPRGLTDSDYITESLKEKKGV